MTKLAPAALVLLQGGPAMEKKSPTFEEMVRMRIVWSVPGMDAVVSRRDLVYKKTGDGEPTGGRAPMSTPSFPDPIAGEPGRRRKSAAPGSAKRGSASMFPSPAYPPPTRLWVRPR